MDLMRNKKEPSLDYLGYTKDKSSDLQQYGMPRRSGRYPWGSGKDPFQHRSGDFVWRVDKMLNKGITFTDDEGKLWTGKNAVAKTLGMSSTEFRAAYAAEKNERRRKDIDVIKSLISDGYSKSEIGRMMGVNESTVRSILNSESEKRANVGRSLAQKLKEEVDKKKMIDIGTQVDTELGVSKETMAEALYLLKKEGYNVYGGRMPQVSNPNQMTTLKVLTTPEKEHKDIFEYGAVQSVSNYTSRDGGATFQSFQYPSSMNSKRLAIRYAEDGGIQKDGIIELRRGCADLDLGGKRYSQVRILVDNSKYLKGMAIYSDDMPPGVDVVFNTNKTRNVKKLDVLKDIKNDPENPFGSTIKANGQSYYDDPKGKFKDPITGKRQSLSLINKRADEGDWSEWKDKLPAQFLSKQSLSLAKQQLNIAINNKVREYEEISNLTNPTVKKTLLQSYANDCDSAAVHLYAAALPRQKYHVIIPVTSLKDNEIYAPNYNNGESVALIRFPHGGTFEIPILKVNNNQKVAKKLLGNVKDAVGINSNVAERLSGADFDGDTAMVIPTNNRVRITSTPRLKGLVGFDPKIKYATTKKVVDGQEEYYNANGIKIKVMNNTQNEMGRISNLITDMNLRGAKEEELARAVRHSMVVIDAKKHKLDYKQSEIDNNIKQLKEKYQGRYDENGKFKTSASTLISRAKGETSVPKTQGSPRVNQKGKDWYDPSRPEGALIYKQADDLYYVDRTTNKKNKTVTLKTTKGPNVTYDWDDKVAKAKYEPVKKVAKDGTVSFTNKDGSIQYKVKMRTQKSTQMADTDDATTLISDGNTPMERLYAQYANKMKSLANEARKSMVTTADIPYNKDASKVYAKEVASLDKKLQQAQLNKPRERAAHRIANSKVAAMKLANPDMTNDEVKKKSDQALKKAREEVGAQRTTIQITDSEWNAIQLGAISHTKLEKILANTDLDLIKEKATPREQKGVTKAKQAQIQSLSKLGYTYAEIAKQSGLSVSQIQYYLNGKE